jgi:hypothetical protein
MKKILLSIAVMMLFVSSYAQQEGMITDDTLRFPKERNKGSDIFIFDFYQDLWNDVPSNIKARDINQGFNFNLMKNYPIGTSNFSLAVGLGISSHNFYSDGVPVLGRDSLNKYNGTTTFTTLGSYYQKKVEYVKNKLNITYFEIPIELKFKTRDAHNRQLKFSFGFKVGYEIANHTKYVGNDVLENTDDQVTIKKYNIQNINKWSYGVTARVGRGMFNLFGYYSLSKVFEKDKGPQMYPISVGVSFTPY